MIQFKIAKKNNSALDAIGCNVFAIPARSSDVNPIENIFKRIREKLIEDAITHQIKRENVRELSTCVKKTSETNNQELW